MNAIVGYRIAHWFYKHKMGFMAKIIRAFIYLVHNCYLPYTAEIGKGTKLGYKGIGVVVHAHAVIGEHCVIAQNVTIGGRAGHDGVPIIGNHVFIGAGAVILGGVSIGDYVTIGANAVVLQDIPSNCACVGIPARIVENKDNKYGVN